MRPTQYHSDGARSQWCLTTCLYLHDHMHTILPLAEYIGSEVQTFLPQSHPDLIVHLATHRQKVSPAHTADSLSWITIRGDVTKISTKISQFDQHCSQIQQLRLVSHHATSVDNFRFHTLAVDYLCEPWESGDGVRAAVSFFLPQSKAVANVEKSLLSFCDCISRCGTLCHGVIDLDWWIANHCGDYYLGQPWEPSLPDRDEAATFWESLGSDRVIVARDAREGVVLGSALASRLWPENVVINDCNRKFGLTQDVRTKALGGGAYAVLLSPSIASPALSIRSNAQTREQARSLQRAMEAVDIIAKVRPLLA